MKRQWAYWTGAVLLLQALHSPGAVRYVSLLCTNPVSPFVDWSTAATNIQDAVDAATDGDEVLVNDGVYQTGTRVVYGLMMNRVAVTKAVGVRSLNGPAVATITGGYISGMNRSVRCVYLASGATLSGFTLTNGTTMTGLVADDVQEGSGGGMLCASSTSTASNCVFVGNFGYYYGGAVYGGTLKNCILSNNAAFAWGGGAHSSRLNGCLLTSNTVTSAQGGGGTYGGTLTDCTLSLNRAALGAGAYGSVLSNCLLTANTATTSGGGAYNSRLRNCVVTGNAAASYGGGTYSGSLIGCAVNGNSAGISGGGVYQGVLTNSTIVGNRAVTSGGGTFNGTLRNTIVYYNDAPAGSNYSGGAFYYCLAAPLPAGGTGNLTNDPQLASLSHLSDDSPCIGAGSALFAKGTDIDGELWNSPPSIGCDERHASAVTGPLSVSIQVDFTNVATGVPVLFTARVEGRINRSDWDFGDGTRATNCILAPHAWSTPGDYAVRLTAYNESYPDGVAAVLTMHLFPPSVHYVTLDSTNPIAPFLSWETAATNIQDAIDSAFLGGIVLVSNGVYSTGGRLARGAVTNRVSITKPLWVRSVNGPASTTIEGYQVPGTTTGNSALRCVYLTNGATLEGFTLTKGATRTSSNDYAQDRSGAGAWMEPSALVSNCVIRGNVANFYGGGAFSGRIVNSAISGNTASYGGGVCSNQVRNSWLTDNSASQGGAASGASLEHCTITGNSAPSAGGVRSCVLSNCLVCYNQGFSEPNYTSSTLNYCCTTPLPSSGLSNLALEPQLTDFAHIGSGSPCRRFGSPEPAFGADIDGEAWANPPSIGCDEVSSNAVFGPLSVSIKASYTNVASGFLTSFTGQIDGHATANEWDFGDGMTATNQPYPTHFWTTDGVYTVVFRAYNDSYPTGVSATVTVLVTDQPTHYVDASSTNPTPPFLSWSTAATNIQDAVDAAVVGGLVLVTNGSYTAISTTAAGDNILAVLAPKIVRSINGPAATVIDGTKKARCVFLANGAMLAGFTLTNGSGGGVRCESSSTVVSNCVISGNTASDGGGTSGGTLYDCLISGNAATPGSGGGANGSTLNRCIVGSNSAAFVGGGAESCTLNDCTLVANTAWDYNGGGADHCTANRCKLLGNRASTGGGAYACVLNNCVVAGNSAIQAGGTLSGGLYNCTVVGNYASDAGSGSWGGVIDNCILYYNNGANYTSDSLGISINFCCTTPLPAGPGNITNEPAFVDLPTQDYRLQTNSPCINSGRRAYVSGGLDLDSNPRIAGSTVDIGAYEFQSPASVLSYAWAQRYCLPTDGSADYADPDLDGMNNSQEWIAGTDPTNAASALRLSIPEASPSGALLCWAGVSNRTYYLQRATNFSGQLLFTVLQTNIAALATNSFTDTNLPASGTAYYRLGAEY